MGFTMTAKKIAAKYASRCHDAAGVAALQAVYDAYTPCLTCITPA
jgi:hypothetical protein